MEVHEIAEVLNQVWIDPDWKLIPIRKKTTPNGLPLAEESD